LPTSLAFIRIFASYDLALRLHDET
jgi:hypothetical protein